jgi:hypothetical protein
MVLDFRLICVEHGLKNDLGLQHRSDLITGPKSRITVSYLWKPIIKG